MYKYMIKIGHIINPFKCDKENSSYLYYAQPITFKSMLIAKRRAQRNKNLKVNLFSINYPEDDVIVPNFFTKLPHLKRSSKDLYDCNKKLPFLQDIFNSILKHSNCDFIIFTNSDISVKPNFYEKVYQIIKKEGRLSFTINRRDNIPKFYKGKRLTSNDLNVLNQFRGELHQGYDCFIIHRHLLKKLNLMNLFIGYPPWGTILVLLLKKFDRRFKVCKNLMVTYHLGKDKSWKLNNGDNLLHTNIKNAVEIKSRYNLRIKLL